MRVMLFLIYTFLHVALVLLVLAIRQILPSPAWNRIAWGFLLLMAVGYTSLLTVFFPYLREDPETAITIRTTYHALRVSSLIIIVSGFYTLRSNLRGLFKFGQRHTGERPALKTEEPKGDE